MTLRRVLPGSENLQAYEKIGLCFMGKCFTGYDEKRRDLEYQWAFQGESLLFFSIRLIQARVLLRGKGGIDNCDSTFDML